MPFSYKDAAAETKRFVRKLRRSDESTRRRWFLGAITTAMVVVLTAWGLYIGTIVPPVISSEETSPASVPASKLQPQQAERDPSVFEVFTRGLSVVGDDIKQKYKTLSEAVIKGLNTLKRRFEEPNRISIQGADINFAFEGLEKIPPTPLP